MVTRLNSEAVAYARFVETHPEYEFVGVNISDDPDEAEAFIHKYAVCEDGEDYGVDGIDGEKPGEPRADLVPAAMTLLGERNWYLPRSLQWLPHLEVEGAHERRPGTQPAADSRA